jgi:hypothetical protein
MSGARSTVVAVVCVAEGAAPHGLIIRLIIQTIRQDPSGAVWTDEAPNVSRLDPSGADQTDAEHQSTDLAVSRRAGRCCTLGVPLRSDMAAGWWTVLRPAVQRGRCCSVPMPCGGGGCPQCRGVRAPGVRQAASGVQPYPDSRSPLAAST